MGGSEYKLRALKRRSGKKRKGFCTKKSKCEEINSREALETDNCKEAAATTTENAESTGENIANFRVSNHDTNVAGSNTRRTAAENDPSLSSKKLQETLDNSYTTSFDYGVEGTLFMNIEILLDVLRKTSMCPDCPEKVNVDVKYKPENKVGLAHFFEMNCHICDWSETFCTSRTIKSTRGKSTYEINISSIIAFRECGLGYSGIKNFCGMMNMPPPMSKTAFQKSSKPIREVYVNTAEESMSQAAREVRKNFSEDAIVDTTASFDGTWQKRGHISFNGVVTAMSILGKCIDYSIKSKVCKSCQFWREKENTEEYMKWKETHICAMNHDGSAGKMETEGLKEIYGRSVEKRGLRYITFLGDGDSKSFTQVAEMKPYGDDKPLSKAECVGHVQKRVGTRLRDLKVKYRGVKLSDGKTIGGAGRLNERTINMLQNYYGIAIRQNNELYPMKKSVAAVLHHCSAAETMEERHKYCPRTSDSWCKYQVDNITGNHTYKVKLSIPHAIYEILKPIFSHSDLGSDEVLKRCLHGRTQNVNECINNTIWTRCPKRVYVGLQTMEIGVASSVISFNDGGLGLLPVFDQLNINRGNFRMTYLQNNDAERVKSMERKLSVGGKRRRTKLRSIRKKFIVIAEDKEGELYSKGRFHV